jgi:hypothetical protein
MRKFYKSALFVASLTVGFVAPSEAAVGNRSSEVDITPVSTIQLISTPERFEGKQIDTKGFFTYENENIAIYVNKLDADERVDFNSIEINFKNSKLPINLLKKLNRHYVRVIGRVEQGFSQWLIHSRKKQTVITNVEAVYLLRPER